MSAIPEPTIIRSHRSSITLQITRDGELIVKAPLLIPPFVIKRFVKNKSAWIEKTFAKIEKIKPAKRLYKEGEIFFFLGKPYTLKFAPTLEIVLQDERLLFPQAAAFRAEKELRNWYMKQAREIITKRLEYHAEKMQATYRTLLFSDTKSKWGTCFPDNSLQFNWRLVMAPLMVLDYVIIHELTHTTEKNHRDAFWRKVRLFTPAYKQHRKWLNDNAHLLTV